MKTSPRPLVSISSDLLERRGGRLRLTVRLTPKAAAERIDGIMPEAGGRGAMLKVSVTAPPEKGKANAALIRFLAREWGLSRSAIRIHSGETARRKVLEIDASPEDIGAAIAARLAGAD